MIADPPRRPRLCSVAGLHHMFRKRLQHLPLDQRCILKLVQQQVRQRGVQTKLLLADCFQGLSCRPDTA